MGDPGPAPGERPLEALAAQLLRLGTAGGMQQTPDRLAAVPLTLHLAGSLALAERPPGTRLLLVVDQFEEVFSAAAQVIRRVGGATLARFVPRRPTVAQLLRSAFIAVAVSLALSAAAHGASAGSPPVTLQSTDIVSRLREGKPLLLEHVRIRDLDLTPLRVVRPVFRCRDCRVDGSLVGANVRFESTLDFSGLHVGGRTDFHGATFGAPVLFGGEFNGQGGGATFTGGVEFSLATFDDLVSFNGATFEQGASFDLTRFRSDTVFADTTFDHRVSFTAAIFGGASRFDQADFAGGVNLDRASFRSRADLRRSDYGGAASFAEAEFQRDADFSEATFDRPATFTRARFTEGASFAGVHFSGEMSDESASFERATSRGRLTFTDATFSRDLDFRDVTAEAVSFDHATIASRATLLMRSLAAKELILTVDDTDRVSANDRTHILGLIESSAKVRGDIGLANDAHYRLRALASHDDQWLWRAADAIFYRGIAGYFVRPLRPLLVLLVLAAVLAVAREVDSARRADAGGPSRGPFLRQARRVLVRLFDSLASIGRGADDASSGASVGGRIEILMYRVLVVCALIGLANSNPTLRQMFDALL